MIEETASSSLTLHIPDSSPWRWPDWLIVTLLFFGLSTLYYATASGITSSNDGSHYALARTLVANQTFALRQFDDFAEGNDIALRDGELYSDRPPGTALLTAVFYAIGDLLPAPPARLPSRHDAENGTLAYVLLLPVWAGTAVVLLLYALLRQGIGRGGALLTSLFFALGTSHWKYSSVLFSHALSGFLVLMSVWLALRLAKRPSAPWLSRFGLGLLLGYAVLVEYANGLLVLLVAVYLLLWQRPFRPMQIARGLLPLILGGLLPALFLAFYNNSNFGSPFTLSYAYAVNYPWAGELSSTFSTPLRMGLPTLLWWGKGGGNCNPTCFNQGLFLLSPLWLAALPGLWFYLRQRWRGALLTLTLFGVYMLLFAKHFTAHGFTADGRYLVPFYGLLALPLGYFVAWLLRQKRPLVQLPLTFLLYGLFFLSLRNIFLHIGLSFNYTLDLSRLSPLIASPENWRYLAMVVLKNGRNLPLLWIANGLLLVAAAAVGSAEWWRRSR